MADIQSWRTPEAVRAWLMAQPEGAVVGLKGRYHGCTLGMCYGELSGLPIGVSTNAIDVGSTACPLTDFELRFIHHHDEHGSHDARDGDPVTRERALAILDAIQVPA